MSDEELIDFLIAEAEHSFSGWDFSHIIDRVVNSPLSWSYTSLILPLIRKAENLLDMGTGGGEFLASLAPLPKFTSATENYEPNVSIARMNLNPLGVKVFYCAEKNHLPFKDDEFDVIINRHEYYSPKEVHRILKTNGLFITQQVGDENDSKLRLLLTGKNTQEIDAEWNLTFASKKLKETGFNILAGKEDLTLTRIFDVGAIVYYLKAVPWELPGFSVKKYYSKLVELHHYITDNEFLDLAQNNHRFVLIAEKIPNS
ncbi:MAG: class I SAM-dependent methyltransferase [Promethearchaeota archaeon]